MCEVSLVSKSSENVIFARIQIFLLEDAASSHPPKFWFAKTGHCPINVRAYMVMQKFEESYCPCENLTEVDVEQELKKTNKNLMNASNLQVLTLVDLATEG